MLRGHRESIAKRLERDLEAMTALPGAPFDACHQAAGQVSSQSLVRYHNAVFDLWIGNEDRVCNLMASIGRDTEYLVVAFDHGRTLLGCMDDVFEALDYLKNPHLPNSHPMSGMLNRAHCDLMVERIRNIKDDLIYEVCDLGVTPAGA